jgi:predicted metal-dependent peptidase
MNHTAADLVAAARMAVLKRHPYLSHVLFSLRPVEAPGLGTMGVDKGWRLYYDPETVQQWHEESVEARLQKIRTGKSGSDGIPAVVFHELGHVLRRHFTRMRELAETDPGGVNAAQDREINDDVVQAGWVLPGEPLLPSDVGMPEGLLAEEYYRSPAQKTRATETDSVPGCGGACGSIAHNPTVWEKKHGASNDGGSSTSPAGLAPGGGARCPAPLPNPVSALEQEITLRRTALAIEQHLKSGGKGNVPRGLQAWAKTLLAPPKVDWRKRLASLCRQSLVATAGACDFTWRRSGRRSLHSSGRSGWPISPALQQPVPRVGIVLDSSGSMQCPHGERTPEDEALSEVLGIAKATGAETYAVACDAQAYDVVRIAGLADLEKLNRGGGGTDMRPGFAAIKVKKPSLIVIVTDGIVGNDWPSKEDCRGTRVLVALVGGSGQKPPRHLPFVEVL